jgi:16S rRNA C1402 N4-methylase RsmH
MNAEDARVARAVGRQLPTIARAVDGVAECVAAGGRLILVGAGTSGRLAVITFHSLEDRVVKTFLRGAAFGQLADPTVPRVVLVNRKPIVADADEIARNRRSRTAKLRVAERV